MSRSYKKTPYIGYKDKFYKRYSNKRIRQQEKHQKEVTDGSSFKKLFDSWEICDYKSIVTYRAFKQYVQSNFSKYQNGGYKYFWQYYCQRYKLNPDKPNWKKLYQIWYKTYKNK